MKNINLQLLHSFLCEAAATKKWLNLSFTLKIKEPAGVIRESLI